MKIAILGFAGQGKSSYEYWQRPCNEITIHDANENLYVTEGIKTVTGPDYLKDLDRYDMVIRTPALHPDNILEANPENPQILDKVWSNTNEFLKVCPTKNIIGVTGTKGKGTTSTLIAKILEAAGKKVHLGGNIGTPPLDLLKDTGDLHHTGKVGGSANKQTDLAQSIRPDDWVVLELANFQLIDIKFSPRIAVCLMVAPEHMDWHKDMDEYITAKQQLFRWQTVHDLSIFNNLNAHSREVVSVSAGEKLPYEVPTQGAEPQIRSGAYLIGDEVFFDIKPVCKRNEIALLGRHNIENVCAAIAATWHEIGGDISAIKKVVSTFKGLEYRLELVRELNGVKYYNDSFGTTPETAMVAVQAFEEPKVLILGGSDKGSSYESLAHIVSSHNVRKVILIGEMAEKIKQALHTAGFNQTVDGGNNLKSIVDTAREIARPGDVVLFSTACASFDMFENYKDRGERFNRIVQELV